MRGKKAYRRKRKIKEYREPFRFRMPRLFSGKSMAVLLGGFLVVLLLILLGTVYHVRTITVEGNVHYTNDEIIAMVMKNELDNNSLYLSLKYRNKGIEGIPFVEKMDVQILSPDSIKIIVYEKSVAGYVECLGKYLYFDKDGIVVESSSVQTEGIPQITGLKFDHVVLYEPLPVDEPSVFQAILDMTQLLTKYEISADRIYFDKDYKMTLYFEEIRVRLGDTDNIDDKIVRLKAILPELAGKKGVLRMENYQEGTKNVTFEVDT